MDTHDGGACKAVIEHEIKITVLEKEVEEAWEVIRAMGKTANNIYVAVLASLLALLGNIAMFWLN
ncbi:MAG: hypothetical protein ACTSW1_08235 [Candidatus Hodarchaeales archaeon]